MGAIQWTSMAEVQSRPVQWLWEGRVPFGKVTLLEGEPGSGKSLVALDLAARVSRGAAMPISRAKPAAPANVLIYNDDDSLADTVRPRLEAAGADLARIRCFDQPITAADVVDLRPSLIIIDPLSVYFCLDDQSAPRQTLRNLSLLARDSGAAVVVVQYLPKNGSWMGEVYDSARSVVQVATIGHSRHRVSVTKSNLEAIGDVSPLVFHFESTDNAVKISGWADSV